MTSSKTQPPLEVSAAEPGSRMVLWVLWATYGSFYFCRQNLSAAMPGILEEFKASGLTKADMATVLAVLKITYGIGQFINGQLAERIRPRTMLAIGMLTSLALNVLFGFVAGAWFFTFIWAMNGYAQSFGWSPTMRVAANWVPARVRGRSIGIIGTGYMVGASLTYVVAGVAAETWGWRAALFIPSGILFVSCVHMFFLLREAPEDHRHGAAIAKTVEPKMSVSHTLRITLGNRDLWLLAIALGLLNACRYGFLDWGVLLIKEVQGEGVGKSAIKFAILPAGGILGSLGAGWITDRFFGGRRAPVICGLLVALAVLTIVFKSAVGQGTVPTVTCLFFIGVAIYGPQVLLVGTAPTDLARGGAVAAAVGFVNCIGYVGASAGDLFTGLIAPEDAAAVEQWYKVVWLWAAWAFLAAIAVALLWRRTAVRERTQS